VNGGDWTEIDWKKDNNDAASNQENKNSNDSDWRESVGSFPWTYTDLDLSLCKKTGTHIYRHGRIIWDSQAFICQ
jgi:hypothetical protein